MTSTAVTAARLDYFSVKEYLSVKTLGIFLGLFLLFLLVMDMAAMAAAMSMMYAFLFSSYPFLLSEKNNSDILYASLPLSAKSLVIGRYLFVLSLFVAIAAAAALLTSLCAPFVETPLSGKALLSTTLGSFTLFSTLAFIQMPIYFKVDYSRAKTLAYAPVLIMFIGAFTLARFFPEADLYVLFARLLASPPATIAAAALVWLAILAVSCRLSMAFYKKKEF